MSDISFSKSLSCSFCGVHMPASLSSSKGHVLCWRCLYEANVKIGNIPEGALYCFHCKHTESFVFYYSTDGTRAGWSIQATDEDGIPVYAVKAVKGNWRPKLIINKIVCVHCKAHAPLWMSEVNKYVRKIHFAGNQG